MVVKWTNQTNDEKWISAKELPLSNQLEWFIYLFIYLLVSTGRVFLYTTVCAISTQHLNTY